MLQTGLGSGDVGMCGRNFYCKSKQNSGLSSKVQCQINTTMEETIVKQGALIANHDRIRGRVHTYRLKQKVFFRDAWSGAAGKQKTEVIRQKTTGNKAQKREKWHWIMICYVVKGGVDGLGGWVHLARTIIIPTSSNEWCRGSIRSKRTCVEQSRFVNKTCTNKSAENTKFPQAK